MAKEKINAAEIQKLLKEKRIVIGTDRAKKGLKRGIFERILLSSSCPDDVKNDISHYAKISSVDVIKLKYSNEELGVVCKKPFSISVISVLKVKSDE